MSMTPEEMIPGKMYFVAYGSQPQLIVRFKSDETTQMNFFDHIQYWNGFEQFHKGGYAVHSGITEIREANQAEKHLLFRNEIQNNCV